MPRPSFLQIVKDPTEPLWIISSIAILNSGQFLIICKSEKQAKDVVSRIENDMLNYPTVSQNGYTDISNNYPLFKGKTRVFEVN